MSRRPRTDLSRVCRALHPWLAVFALLCSVAPARAQLSDAGLADARVAPLSAAAASADAGLPSPTAAAPDAAGDAVAAAHVTPPRPGPGPGARWLAEGGEADDDEPDEPVVAMPGRERSTDLKYLLERVEVQGNRKTKVRMVEDFVPLEVGSSFSVSDPEIEALRYRLLGTGWYDKVELSLKRGQQPGWVVLVIQVEERRTLVFQELAAGLGWSTKRVEGKRGPNASATRLAEPYLGLALADTNFLGTGKTFGGEVLISPDQQGVALGYNDPVVRSSNWAFRTRATFVNGQEYFGGDNVLVDTDCSKDDREQCQKNARVAVVDYWRAGLSLGTARDVGSYTRLTLDWRGDLVYIPPWGMPQASEELRGRDPILSRHAIDYAIEPDVSFVSTISVGFTYDKRDSAILPTRGTLASFLGDLASPLIGSDYEFVRLQGHVNHWIPLRWKHTIRLGLFAGAVFKNAPFFYKFFVTDLTDLQPARILGLNLDHRPAPNLFGLFECGRVFDSKCGTSVAQMRQEELAARIDAEYVWPLVRGRRKFVKGADAYVRLGLYTLLDPRDFRIAIPGYKGFAKVPLDLTADIGVKLDTQIGVFQIGLAKLLGAVVNP